MLGVILNNKDYNPSNLERVRSLSLRDFGFSINDFRSAEIAFLNGGVKDYKLDICIRKEADEDFNFEDEDNTESSKNEQESNNTFDFGDDGDNNTDNGFDFGSTDEGDDGFNFGDDEGDSEEDGKKPVKEIIDRKDESTKSISEIVRTKIPSLIAKRYRQADKNIKVIYEYLTKITDKDIRDILESVIEKYKTIMYEISEYLKYSIRVDKYEDIFQFNIIISSMMNILKTDVERIINFDKV